MRTKKCPKTNGRNIDINRIPRGTPIVDCGAVFVAKVPGGAAVVFWEGRFGAASQRKLSAAARRGRW